MPNSKVKPRSPDCIHQITSTFAALLLATHVPGAILLSFFFRASIEDYACWPAFPLVLACQLVGGFETSATYSALIGCIFAISYWSLLAAIAWHCKPQLIDTFFIVLTFNVLCGLLSLLLVGMGLNGVSSG